MDKYICECPGVCVSMWVSREKRERKDDAQVFTDGNE